MGGLVDEVEAGPAGVDGGVDDEGDPRNGEFPLSSEEKGCREALVEPVV